MNIPFCQILFLALGNCEASDHTACCACGARRSLSHSISLQELTWATLSPAVLGARPDPQSASKSSPLLSTSRFFSGKEKYSSHVYRGPKLG